MKGMEQKKEELKQLLQKCWLLNGEEKTYWISNLESIPETQIDVLIKQLSEFMNQADSYIEAGLADDKENQYFNALKAEIQKIKKNAFGIEEEKSKAGLDEELEKQIQKL